ncbi:MAG: 3-phenylpropionate/trans-cinnamate dioxygenase ferredoxin reductase subunit [Halioglobus sp.]|jgi:3-phenylpropionate/trans-cinnamate dioxygenase ferredoxin reductase subunit
MNHDKAHFIVVGGGHAAGQLLESLRKEGFTGKLSLISEEHLLPYQRPHLSKLYLSGELAKEKLLYRPTDFYSENKIDVLLGERVDAIEPKDKIIILANGAQLHYDKLALTTGARIRKLSIPGTESKGVFYLRTADDVDHIRDALAQAKNVVLIGGGFLGLEAASVMTEQGKSVTVLEMQERVMATAVAPAVSDFYEELHRNNRVDIRTNVQVQSIEEDKGYVKEVVCKDGTSYPADLVIISIGITPNIELAKNAKLSCDNGICVDEYALTSDPNIVSAGDCTIHPNRFLDRTLRLESVHNAVEQAKTAAASMCGHQSIYEQVPWFWSDQYDHRLQMVGIPGNDDNLHVRGDIKLGKFSVWFFSDGQLTACHAVNSPKDYMACRKLMENRIAILPEQLADARLDLHTLLPRKAPLAFQKRKSLLQATGS